MPELHERSEHRIRQLYSMPMVNWGLVGALELYRRTFDASTSFVESVKANYENRRQTAWEFLSAITQQAQGYSWTGRMFHEDGAGKFSNMLLADEHMKMAEEIAKKVDR